MPTNVKRINIILKIYTLGQGGEINQALYAIWIIKEKWKKIYIYALKSQIFNSTDTTFKVNWGICGRD
jgi:hypothetical protein